WRYPRAGAGHRTVRAGRLANALRGRECALRAASLGPAPVRHGANRDGAASVPLRADRPRATADSGPTADPDRYRRCDRLAAPAHEPAGRPPAPRPGNAPNRALYAPEASVPDPPATSPSPTCPIRTPPRPPGTRRDTGRN